MKILLYSLSSAAALSALLAEHLTDCGIEVIRQESDDLAFLAKELSEKLGKEAKKAVFLGNNGIDAYARAAAFSHLAPVVCHDPLQADNLRQKETHRTLCIGSRIIKPKYAVSIVDVWLMNDRMEEDYGKEPSHEF